MERLRLEKARITLGIIEIEQDGEWLPASDAQKLSEGVANSEGNILIGNDVALYIVNTQPDVQNVIDKAIEALDLIAALGNSVALTGAPLSPATAVEAEALKVELQATELI